MPNLTPGDFRTVRERLFFLAGKNGADDGCLSPCETLYAQRVAG